MEVAMRNIVDLIPYDQNTKLHDQTQIDNVAESLRQFGWAQPVVIDKNDVIIIGHCRVLAAKKLGMDQAPCVCMDDLTPEQVRALRIVDNKTNESPWDMEMLDLELPEVDLSGFDFDFELSGENEEDENPYTTDENAPIYEIQGEQPKIDELFDHKKADELIKSIEGSKVPDDIKPFLISAAGRHVRYNYRKIAEYYAAAAPEVQRLFEESALVIIDYDSAIKNGFTKLSRRIREMRNES